jgi:hypothetical protein
MRKLAPVGFCFIAVVCFASSAYAQTCAGGPAVTNARPFQGGAGVAFADDLFVVAGTGSYGTDSLIAGVTLARGTFDSGGLDLSSTVLGVNAGLQLAVKAVERSMFCPIVVFTKTFGPKDILGTGVDASESSIGGGGSFGVIVGDGSGIQLVPTVGLQVARVKQTLEVLGISASESDTNGSLNLGLGILVTERVSVLPTVRIPFGVEDGKNLYGVAVLFSFGK